MWGMDITEHYGMLLGLPSPWKVVDVKLSLMANAVDVYVEYRGEKRTCPVCGETVPGYDATRERTWRHLDVMQFETRVHCRLPRCNCAKHGVKTLKAPWEGECKGFTLLFERFAVEVLKACSTIEQARKLLRITWLQAHRIMAWAVHVGQAQCMDRTHHFLAMDEKSFKCGQSFVSVLYSHTHRCVVDVAEGRSEAAGKAVIQAAIPESKRREVKGVTMDFSAPYANAVRECLPCARLIADRFHVSKLLNEAIDTVRRQCVAQPCYHNSLTNTRWLWLKDRAHMTDQTIAKLEALLDSDLPVVKAWRHKESFRHFYTRPNINEALDFLTAWCLRVKESGLAPLIRAARTIYQHSGQRLNAYRFFHLTNALAEGFNAKIQALKTAARGFRNVQHYRIAILFYCGALPLPTHTN